MGYCRSRKVWIFIDIVGFFFDFVSIIVSHVVIMSYWINFSKGFFFFLGNGDHVIG